MLSLIAMSIGGLVIAADPSATDRLTGKELTERLSEPVQFVWPERPIAEGFAELSSQHRLSLMFDGAVNAQTTVFGSPPRPNMGLEEVMDMVAQIANAHVIRIGNVLYVAPRAQADAIATSAQLTAQQFAALPANLQAKLREAKALDWTGERNANELARPLADELGLAISGTELLDDIVPKAALAKVTQAELLLLLAAQAKAAVAIDASAIRFSELPANATLSRQIRLPTSTAATRAEKSWPDVIDGLTIARNGTTLTVTGGYLALRRLDFLRKLEEDLKEAARANPAKPREGEAPPKAMVRVYSLRMINTTLGRFASELERVSGFAVKLDEESLQAAGRSTVDRLSCVAENVTIDQLLAIALKGLGLTFRIEGKTVTITAPPAAADEKPEN